MSTPAPSFFCPCWRQYSCTDGFPAEGVAPAEGERGTETNVYDAMTELEEDVQGRCYIITYKYGLDSEVLNFFVHRL